MRFGTICLVALAFGFAAEISPAYETHYFYYQKQPDCYEECWKELAPGVWITSKTTVTTTIREIYPYCYENCLRAYYYHPSPPNPCFWSGNKYYCPVN